MALFGDGNITSIAGLTEYESSVVDAANIEGIDLAAKAAVAHREVSLELEAFLQRFGRPAADLLSNVVVTEGLRHWHALQALAATFRDAYHQQLNDRHLGKWREYARQAADARELLFEIGVGMVASPVPAPPTPVPAHTTGSLAGATWYCAASWVGETGAEGAISAVASYTTPDNSRLTVAMGGEAGAQQGWNVYVGAAGDELTLQNETPVAPGATWTMPDTGLETGREPASGQPPEWFVRRGTHTMLRG